MNVDNQPTPLLTQKPPAPSETEEGIAREAVKQFWQLERDFQCGKRLAIDSHDHKQIILTAIRKAKAQAQVTPGEGGKLLYAASSALLGLLQHAGIADQHTEDIDSVDHKAESVARNIREQIRAFLEREKASPETKGAPEVLGLPEAVTESVTPTGQMERL